jgi:HEAT repeat protein
MRPSLLLLFSLVFVAAAKGPDTKELVENLRSPRLRAAAYRELMRRKDPKAVHPLTGLLPELDLTGQLYGVNILAATDAKAATDSLKLLSKLGDPHLRVTAGSALYRKGDRSALLSMADALLERGVSPLTLRVMITRLYSVPEPVIQASVARLLEPEADHLLLYYALYFLSRQNAKDVAPDAARLLVDERPGIRALAGSFLLRFGYEEFGEKIAGPLRDGKLDKTWWGWVRSYLLGAQRISDGVLDAVVARLPAETDRTVLLQMIALLGQEAYRPAAKVLRERVGDGDRTIAGAAFDALTKIPGGLTTDDLENLLADPEPAIRLKAVDALRRMDDLSGFPVAVAILKKGSVDDRATAAGVVAEFRRSSAVAPLIDALGDDRPGVRAAALDGLTDVFETLYPYRRFHLALTGYDPKAPAGKNESAIRKIRVWWRENRTEDW